MNRSSLRSALPAGLVALLLAVPACSDDDGDVDAGDTTTTETSTTVDSSTTGPSSTSPDTTAPDSTTTPDDGPDTSLAGANTEPKAGDAEGRGALVDVRTGRHDGFDRVTFEFDGDLPGYRIEYVDPPITEDATGDVVAVLGNALLQARFEPASGFDVDTGEVTYDGPDHVTGNGTTNVLEVVGTGDFEAVMHFVIGLDSEAGFTVTTLSDPVRVVVDIES